MRRSLPRLLVSMAIVSAFLAGCGSSGKSGNGGSVNYAKGGTFTYAIPSDPGVFDPYNSQGMFAYSYFAYDSLVNLLQNGKFVSGLAEKWSADAHAATFTLRPNISCSDGAPLTARQVASAINYVVDPKNKSPQRGVNTPTVPLTADGDDATRTIRVEMKKPFGFILETIGQLPIVCAKALKDPKILKSGSDGTGPFVLTKAVPGQTYTFAVRNGYTWGPSGVTTSAPGTPATVVLRVVENETTAANLLLSGQVNLARILGADVKRLQAQGLKSIQRKAPQAWLYFNQIGDRPTADRQVRQALVQSIDIPQIVKVSTGGIGNASKGMVALNPRPCSGDTVAGRLPTHDVTAAGASLDAAGWTKGADGTRGKNGKPLNLNLHYVPALSPYLQPAVELMARQWNAVGVHVKLTADTVATMFQVRYQTGNYDLYFGPFAVNLPNQVVPYFSGPVPPAGTNDSGVHNPDYTALAAKAQAMTAPEACTYWNQAEQALYRNVDIAPISDTSQFYFLRNAQAQYGGGFKIPIPTSIRLLR